MDHLIDDFHELDTASTSSESNDLNPLSFTSRASFPQKKDDRHTPEHIVSPTSIRDLPEEILWQIISCFQDWNVLDDRRRNRQWQVPGWRLTLVCSQWRRIALGMPGLWSKIQLSVHDRHSLKKSKARQGRRKSASLVKLLLARSGNSGLNIRLYKDVAPKQLHPAVVALWTSVDRWQSLDIRDMNAYEDTESLLTRPCPFSSLETASVKVYDVNLEILFLEAPHLRTLRLVWDKDWDFADALEERTFPQIKNVDLQISSQWHLAVGMFPKAEYICLHLMDYFDGPDDFEPPCVLPESCRVLVLDDVDPDLLAEQLGYFRAPKISGLIIRGRYCDAESAGSLTKATMDALMQFRQESGCSLTYIAIKHIATPVALIGRLGDLLREHTIIPDDIHGHDRYVWDVNVQVDAKDYPEISFDI